MKIHHTLSIVFFISGASALIFESIWFRLAGLFLGNSVWASALVMASFMAGLAIGNAVAAYYSLKVRSPIQLYACIEIFIAFSALTVIMSFSSLIGFFLPVFSLILDSPILLNLTRTTIAFCIMLVPTIAMGATLPLLVKGLYRHTPNFGGILGALYGWNTLGAVFGVLLNEILLVRVLGIYGAGFFAAGLNCLAALIILTTVTKSAVTATDTFSVPEPSSVFLSALNRPVIASFACGFILLALEIVWFRFLMLFYNGHSWNFAVMLAVVLGGISIGGLAASKWFFRDRNAQRYLFYLLLCNGILVIILYGNFASFLFSSTEQDPARSIEIAALYLMFPVSFTSGIIFVMLGKKLHERKIPEGYAAGILTMANTFGAMLGALISGFLFIPLLGMELSFLVLGACYGIVALIIEPAGNFFSQRKERVVKGCLFAVFLVAAIFFPRDHMKLFYIEAAAGHYIKKYGEERIAFREGTGETIQYLQKSLMGHPYYHRLITNNYSMTGTGLSAKRYMKLFTYLPVSLLKNPRKALLICFGTGSTAKALTDTDSLEHIDIVDTSKEIFELSSIVYPSHENNPIYDQRVKIHVEDGRFFLQTTPIRYDIITAEPPPPKFNGIVNLYSQEYFQLMYDRLAEGGIATYWLPVYQLKANEAKGIIKGFCNVFKDCSLWTGAGLEWIMTGTRKHSEYIFEEDFSRQWHNPKVTQEMLSLGLTSPEQFGSLFIADGERLQTWLGDTPPLVDNYPLRLSPDSPKTNKHVLEFVAFMNASKSSKNFLASRQIKRMWPSALRQKAEEHFDQRQIINGFLDPMVQKYPTAIALDICINTPELNNYIPWAFRSDHTAQKILLNAEKETVRPHNMDITESYKHLAGLAAAEGQYAQAAQYLEAIAPDGEKQTWENVILQMYLLVIAGEKERAVSIGDAYIQNSLDKDTTADKLVYIWKWLDNVSISKKSTSRHHPEENRKPS